MKEIQNNLIVSCQALEDEPLHYVKDGTSCKDGWS